MAFPILITPPADKFFSQYPHECSPKSRHPASPPSLPPAKFEGGSPTPSTRNHPITHTTSMGTQHRGLPPPPGMTLPDPVPRPPKVGSSYASPLAPVPTSTTQIQSSEESARQWYQAKVEEDKRRQEEERTRQEELKLEQRKIEHTMMRESLEAGVPPPLMPIIFAGIGGGGGAALANAAFDMAQQYFSHQQVRSHEQLPPPPPQQQHPQHQQQQQQQQHSSHQSSEVHRRESKALAQPGYPFSSQSAHPHPPSQPSAGHPPPGQPLPPQPQHAPSSIGSYPAPPYSSPSRSVGVPVASNLPTQQAVPRPSTFSALPHLTTNEPQVQSSSQGQEQQSPTQPIFFHWQPPLGTQTSSQRDPPKTSPKDASGTSDVSSSTPKKRKAQEPHEKVQAPQSAGRVTPPTASSVSAPSSARRRGSVSSSHHSRPGSDPFARAYDPVGRSHYPMDRNRSSSPIERQRSADTSRVITVQTTEESQSQSQRDSSEGASKERAAKD